MSEYIFGQVLTAMVTPFHSDGTINYPMAEKLASHLLDHGSDGLVVCGTTGESPALEEAEKAELLRVVKGAVGDRGKIIMGTGANSTSKAIELTRKAEKIGIDGSLQVVPYYNKPPQEGLYLHFSAIASACPDVPMMLYNIPGRTGTNCEPATIARLGKKFANIVAVKEASGNLEQAMAIKILAEDNLLIYSGEDFLTLPMMTVGGVGVVSVASHLVGTEIQSMIKAYQCGDVKLAQNIQQKLQPLFKILFCDTNPIPLKTALQFQGWDVGSVRLPLSPLANHHSEDIKVLLTKMKLLG